VHPDGVRGMSYANYDDVLQQLADAGLQVGSLEVGVVRRCKVEGEREKRGWYALHELRLDSGDLVLVGSFGVWRGAENNAQKIELKRTALSAEQKAALKTRIREDRQREERRRQAEADRAAELARRVWAKCLPDGQCQYMERKRIGAHGARFTDRGNLVIPIMDAQARIHGLQIIYGDASSKKTRGRDKDYWPTGLIKQGRFFLVGGPIQSVLLIAEGFATAASIHEATGLPVAVAFDAGNLLPVARALHKAHPRAAIVICADDDFLAKCPSRECGAVDLVHLGACPKCGTAYTHGNTGAEKAQAAALAVGGGWIAPRFTLDRGKKKLTDFNDLANVETPAIVGAQVAAAVEAELSKRGPGPVAPTRSTGGRGNNGELKSFLIVDEACDRYSLIYGGRGTLFDHHEHELVPKTDVLDILEEHGWRDWKKRVERRVVRMREVGFDPTGQDGGIRCNLWGGWPTVPRAGSCDRLLELLEHMCGGEANGRDLARWILDWLAYPIQHPGAKMKTALIFHGPQGVGKNLFFEAVMGIYGPYGRIVDQAALEDKFNDWASKKLFLIGDEVVARQELYHTKNKLKAFITGDWIRINPKNVAAHEERNHVNIVFLSNEKQPLVLERDDRRYVVIWTPGELGAEFYNQVRIEIENGGVAALHQFLLDRDLGDFKPWTRPPMTTAKSELITISLDSVERFLAEWMVGETEYPFCPCASMDLYQAYLRWCRSNGVSRPRESNQFLGHIAKLQGWSNQPRHVYQDASYAGATRMRRVVVPAEEHLQRVKKNRPETDTLSKWLTDMVLEFRFALEDGAPP